MICPYCDKEMKAGFLHGGMASMMFWMPEQYYLRHAFAPATKKKIMEEGGIVIRPGFDVQDADVFYVCRDCGRMIAEFGEQKEKGAL